MNRLAHPLNTGRVGRPGDLLAHAEELAILDAYQRLAALILATALADAAQLDYKALDWLKSEQAQGLAESLDIDPALLAGIPEQDAVYELASYYKGVR